MCGSFWRKDFPCKDSRKTAPEQILYCLLDNMHTSWTSFLSLNAHRSAYLPNVHPIIAGWKRTLQSRNSFPCRTGDQRNVLRWSRAVLLGCPDTCPNGMTLAFRIQYKGSDEIKPCIIHSGHFPYSVDTGVLPNTFGIFYFTDVRKLFVYVAGNVTNGKNYYQTEVKVKLRPDRWYHVAMSFSHANGLHLCKDGTKVHFTIEVFLN